MNFHWSRKDYIKYKYMKWKYLLFVYIFIIYLLFVYIHIFVSEPYSSSIKPNCWSGPGDVGERTRGDVDVGRAIEESHCSIRSFGTRDIDECTTWYILQIVIQPNQLTTFIYVPVNCGFVPIHDTLETPLIRMKLTFDK